MLISCRRFRHETMVDGPGQIAHEGGGEGASSKNGNGARTRTNKLLPRANLRSRLNQNASKTRSMSRPQSRAPPPLPSLVTPSASPQPHSAFYRPDSLPPLKRQRLSTPSRASSSSSLQDATFDVEKERGDSVQRLLGTWSQLEERWTRRIDEDDVIDLRTLDVIENRGVLESMSKPREFGISKDSDATRDRASVDDEDDEDSDDDLDAITGFDMNDRPIEDAYSDDNISTTDEDDGSPLQDPLPKPIGHYGRLDINNPKDADDLRAFLEAERLRKALQGDDDRDEIDFEGDSTIVYDDGPPHVEPEEVLQLSEHDDKDNSSEDELAAPEEKLSFFPRKKVIRNVEPIRAVPKPSFKVPKLPDVSSKPSPSKNQQLQTPPRSSSIQSTDFSSLPSPLPSPISPRSRRPSKPAPLQEKIHRSHTSVTDLDKVSRINLSQVHSVDKKGKGTPRTAAQVTKPLTEPSPRPSPSKKSRMHPEVVIVRPKSKERVPVISKPLIKEKCLPSKKLEKTPKPQMEESSSDDESVRELPSSPLKGISKARSSHVVSDSEDDEPLRKPPPRAPRPAVAVPTRKRKRSSDAPRRASSQAVQVDSPDEGWCLFSALETTKFNTCPQKCIPRLHVICRGLPSGRNHGYPPLKMKRVRLMLGRPSIIHIHICVTLFRPSLIIRLNVGLNPGCSPPTVTTSVIATQARLISGRVATSTPFLHHLILIITILIRHPIHHQMPFHMLNKRYGKPCTTYRVIS